jgi:hypothetical protein
MPSAAFFIFTIANSGVNSRNVNDAEDGNPAFDAVVTKFLTILENRLKKSYAVVIQILVLMLTTEAESPLIISSLQEIKYEIDAACSNASLKSHESSRAGATQSPAS